MISDRIEALITHFCKGNKSLFAQQIGVTPSVIGNITGERKGNPSFEVIQKVLDAFASVNPDWFILDRGSMLRDSKNPEETTMDHGTEKVQSTSSDTIALRMMDKLDEKDNIIKEKDAKIDQLQSELRAQSTELGILKARLEHLQDAKEASQWELPNPVKDFTDKSSGDYGEGYLPTKPHTTSKKSSVGKI